MNQTAEPAIRLDGVTRRFDRVLAVDQVELDIREGEFFSLLGPSGCGKTTLLRMIAGFEVPDGGRVLLGGEDVTRRPPNRRPVNTVFQHYELFPHMTVGQNVAYGLRLRKVARDEVRRRVAEMLELVGVGGFEGRRADQLSGGQKQRVALARALVNEPRVLLLDEPLSALDVKLRKRMQRELKAIQHRLGTTFVYVTHDQEEALFLSDRIGIMRDGHLLQVGTPQDIYERPVERFVADFVGVVNELEVVVAEVSGDEAICRPAVGSVVRALAGAELEPGRRVRLAVRPERIAMSASGGDAGHGSHVRGVVESATYLGASTQTTVTCPEVGTLVVHELSDPGRAPLPAGTDVALSWPAEASIVLRTDADGEPDPRTSVAA